jgi:hypothetical protein
MSGGEDFLTSQPAVVVPSIREMDEAVEKEEKSNAIAKRVLQRWKQASSKALHSPSQKGAVFERYLES